jgi:hypothetical protein
MRSVPIIAIRCPATGEDVPTGFTIASSKVFARVAVGQLMVKCQSCGDRHQWSVEDAFLR